MSELAEGAIALTQTQRRQYDEDGFFLIENALSQNEVSDLLNLVDILLELDSPVFSLSL